MKTYIIFDNGGRTLDRYTIINKETGDIFECSDSPDAPVGAGELVGNCASHRVVMCGAGWRHRLPRKSVIKEEVDNYINNARLDPGWLGKEIDLSNMPMNVQHYIARIAPNDDEAVPPSKVNIVYMSRGSENISSGSGM